MSTTVYVPVDASALSLGAEAVARAITEEAARRQSAVNVIRNGSRGAVWLEPLVEVGTSAGRYAYGPVKSSDVPGLFEAGFLQGREHPLAQGLTESIPYLKVAAAADLRARWRDRSPESRRLRRP